MKGENDKSISKAVKRGHSTICPSGAIGNWSAVSLLARYFNGWMTVHLGIRYKKRYVGWSFFPPSFAQFSVFLWRYFNFCHSFFPCVRVYVCSFQHIWGIFFFKAGWHKNG